MDFFEQVRQFFPFGDQRNLCVQLDGNIVGDTCCPDGLFCNFQVTAVQQFHVYLRGVAGRGGKAVQQSFGLVPSGLVQDVGNNRLVEFDRRFRCLNLPFDGILFGLQGLDKVFLCLDNPAHRVDAFPGQKVGNDFLLPFQVFGNFGNFATVFEHLFFVLCGQDVKFVLCCLYIFVSLHDWYCLMVIGMQVGFRVPACSWLHRGRRLRPFPGWHGLP